MSSLSFWGSIWRIPSFVESIKHRFIRLFLTDSTPDNSHREIYSLVVRFVVNFQVEERVVALKELPSKTGESICQLVLDCLKECQVSTDRLIAQCYDNAPNMSGCHKGAPACVTSALRRDIIHIPCGSHTSNLAARTCLRLLNGIRLALWDCWRVIQILHSIDQTLSHPLTAYWVISVRLDDEELAENSLVC